MLIRVVRPPILSPLGRPIGSDNSLPWEGDGGGGALGLNLATGGTFTRSTEGSYLTGAPTDGTAAFLAWAGVDVRRIENRGDGLGPMLLMEGSRTNLLLQSRALDNVGGWSAGTGTITADACPGPDGTVVADRTVAASGSYCADQPRVSGVGTQVSATQWARRVTGTGNGKPGIANGDATATASIATALTTTYQRLELQINTLLRADFDFLACDGRNTWGGAAQALDYASDLQQVEVGYFQSSAIRTTAAAVTRGADALSYAVNQYPSSFLTRGFRFTFAADATSTETAATAGAHMGLVAFDANNYLLLLVSAGSIFLQLITQGSTRVSAGPITWVARGQLLTIECRPSTGQLVVAGATTGNGTTTGTVCSFDAGSMIIGARAAGVSPAFGRFGLNVVPL